MRLNKRIFKKCIEQNSHMADIVHPNAETFPAGKECFHVLDAKRRNAKQMISGGTSHDTYHLFLSEVATERKRWGFCYSIGVMHNRYRQRFRPVILPLQFHTLLEREA